MNTKPSQPAVAQAPEQRKALNESEKKASETQPGSYREEASAEKVVEIPPAGPDKKPIRGLDS